MLKDSEGRAPATVLKRYRRGEMTDGIEAEVRVDVPKAELAHACARCGKWELGSGPRFQRCSGCKARYHCSQTVRTLCWVESTAGLVDESMTHDAYSARRKIGSRKPIRATVGCSRRAGHTRSSSVVAYTITIRS